MEGSDGARPKPPELNLPEDTYWERVYRIASIIDVRMAFVSSSGLERARNIVKEHTAHLAGDAVKQHKGDEVHYAKRVIDAMVHPETGEKIFLPLRMSMIVPVNMTLDALMVMARSNSAVVGCQLLNQTYNAMHYHANRNSSSTMEDTTRLGAFAAATVSSCSIAVGVGQMAKHMKRWGRPVRALAPFTAVATADVVSLAIVRHGEWMNGIDVYDERTKAPLPEKSKIAGLMAVGSCIVSRVAAAASILVLCPAYMAVIERYTSVFRRWPRLRVPILVLLLGLSIQISVPLTFGVFKQGSVQSTAWLEPPLRNVRRSELLRQSHWARGSEHARAYDIPPDDDDVIRYVIYNKGL